MKKKGFTLIELLAVILILAIIAVIVTPIISKIIDEAKTQADKRSAEKYARAAQTFYVESQVDEYKRSFLGSNIIDKLDLENTDAKGIVVAYSDGTTEMAIKIGTKCFTKTTTQDIKDIQVSKDLENCNLVSSSVRISNINSGESSIVITVDNSNDTSISITYCKYGTERGNYALDGLIDGSTCTLSPTTVGERYYYEITLSDGSKLSGNVQGGTGDATPINGGYAGGGDHGGGAGGSGSGGSSSGGSGTGVAAPVIESEQGLTIYDGRYLATVKTIYFDVTNGVKCTNAAWSANGGATTNGMSSGCLRFYAYMEDNLSYTAILDRNTDNSSVAFASNNNNTSGPVTALAKLKSDTDSWQGTVVPKNYTFVYLVSGVTDASYEIPYETDGYKARFITTNEIAKITGNTSFNPYNTGSGGWFYLDGGTSASTGATWQTQIATSSEKSAYYWLYNFMNSCGNYGCYDGGSKWGYWTSDIISGGGTSISWTINYDGTLKEVWNYPRNAYCSTTVNNTCNYGIRPVVTILKSSLN